MATEMTAGGRYLKRGDTRDPEDFRMTYRLGIARQILAGLGILPTVNHSQAAHDLFGKGPGGCDYRCTTSWPVWVTDDAFELAYQLANEVQTKQGKYHRLQAYHLKAQG